MICIIVGFVSGRLGDVCMIAWSWKIVTIFYNFSGSIYINLLCFFYLTIFIIISIEMWPKRDAVIVINLFYFWVHLSTCTVQFVYILYELLLLNYRHYRLWRCYWETLYYCWHPILSAWTLSLSNTQIIVFYFHVVVLSPLRTLLVWIFS